MHYRLNISVFQQAFDNFGRNYQHDLVEELENFQKETNGLLRVCLQTICQCLDELFCADSLIVDDLDDPVEGKSDMRYEIDRVINSIHVAKVLIGGSANSKLDKALTELHSWFGIDDPLVEISRDKMLDFEKFVTLASNLDLSLSNEQIAGTLKSHFPLFSVFVGALQDYLAGHDSFTLPIGLQQVFDGLSSLADEDRFTGEPNISSEWFDNQVVHDLFKGQLFEIMDISLGIILEQVGNMDLELLKKSIDKFGPVSVVSVLDEIPNLFCLLDERFELCDSEEECFEMLNRLVDRIIDQAESLGDLQDQINVNVTRLIDCSKKGDPDKFLSRALAS